MWSTQEKIENCALICSSALPEYEAGTHEARLVFTFYRHLNLAHVLQCECSATSISLALQWRLWHRLVLAMVTIDRCCPDQRLDPRLELEIGDTFGGLVKTGLLVGQNRAALCAAGRKPRTLVMAWLMRDVDKLFDLNLITQADVNTMKAQLVQLRATMSQLHNELTNRPPVTYAVVHCLREPCPQL